MSHPIRTALHSTADIYADITPAVTVRQFTDPAGYLATLAESFGNCEILACEVGSWAGLSALRFAQAFPHGHIVCVDTWLGSSEHWLDRDNPRHDLRMVNGRPDIYGEFMATAANYGDQITPLPQTSIIAAQILKKAGFKFDLIYIDADHSYDGVRGGIRAFLPLLKEGGVMYGDDFSDPRFDVALAVSHELAGFKVYEANWWHWRKPVIEKNA